ncbi:MAG: hypothetical protein WC836_11010 [Desulfobacula sp.]|jgi:hypothetical protein
MTKTESRLSLDLQADICWVPLVQGVMETGAPVLGLDQGKSLRLALAAEEFILHLSKTSPGTRLSMVLTREASCVSALFQFESDPGDLWAMNLTAASEISRDLDQGMAHMGLLLVSRVADRFSIALNGKTISVTLFQDIAYPEIEKAKTPAIALKGNLSAGACSDPAEISHALALVMARYPDALYPKSFRTPGNIIDLISQGDFHAGLVKDETGMTAGMISWQIPSERTVEFIGPYLFSDQPCDTAQVLTDYMINCVARTEALILYSQAATPDIPPGNFEPLAVLTCKQSDGKKESRTLWFRHLREDVGCPVWAHPVLVPFLKKTYDRLFLNRTIRDYKGQGEGRPARSLLGTRLGADKQEAFIRPMLDGMDIRENIERHIQLLLNENYLNLFFTIDLSAGWQAALGKALVETGFEPAYVLPYAGQSDKVIFQYVDPAA